MPLLDHFRRPFNSRAQWETVRERWLHKIVSGLTRILPVEDFRAFIARNGDEFDPDHISPVVIEPALDVPPPVARIEWPWVDEFNVHVLDTRHFGRLSGVVEIVSEDIKRSERERCTFAAKCMLHLRQGASIVIVDAITNLPFNLHNEIMQYCGVRSPRAMLPEEGCYVAAYRYHTDVHRMESWHYSVAIGQSVPTMPLCIDKNIFVPIDLEATYTQALADHNL